MRRIVLNEPAAVAAIVSVTHKMFRFVHCVIVQHSTNVSAIESLLRIGSTWENKWMKNRCFIAQFVESTDGTPRTREMALDVISMVFVWREFSMRMRNWFERARKKHRNLDLHSGPWLVLANCHQQIHSIYHEFQFRAINRSDKTPFWLLFTICFSFFAWNCDLNVTIALFEIAGIGNNLQIAIENNLKTSPPRKVICYDETNSQISKQNRVFASHVI